MNGARQPILRLLMIVKGDCNACTRTLVFRLCNLYWPYLYHYRYGWRLGTTAMIKYVVFIINYPRVITVHGPFAGYDLAAEWVENNTKKLWRIVQLQEI